MSSKKREKLTSSSSIGNDSDEPNTKKVREEKHEEQELQKMTEDDEAVANPNMPEPEKLDDSANNHRDEGDAHEGEAVNEELFDDEEYELLEEDSFTEDADANLAATKEAEKDVEADETEAEATDATKETKEEHEGADEQPENHANGKSADSANEENNRSRNGTSLELPEKAQDKFIRARRLSHESPRRIRTDSEASDSRSPSNYKRVSSRRRGEADADVKHSSPFKERIAIIKSEMPDDVSIEADEEKVQKPIEEITAEHDKNDIKREASNHSSPAKGRPRTPSGSPPPTRDDDEYDEENNVAKNKAIVVAKQEYSDAEKGMNNANVDDAHKLKRRNDRSRSRDRDNTSATSSPRAYRHRRASSASSATRTRKTVRTRVRYPSPSPTPPQLASVVVDHHPSSRKRRRTNSASNSIADDGGSDNDTKKRHSVKRASLEADADGKRGTRHSRSSRSQSTQSRDGGSSSRSRHRERDRTRHNDGRSRRPQPLMSRRVAIPSLLDISAQVPRFRNPSYYPGSGPPPPLLKPSLPMKVSLPKRADRRGHDRGDRYDDRERDRRRDSPPPRRRDYRDDRYDSRSTSTTTNFHQFSAPTKPRRTIVESVTVVRRRERSPTPPPLNRYGTGSRYTSSSNVPRRRDPQTIYPMDRDAGIHRRPAQQSRFQRNSPDGRERHREIKREPMTPPLRSRERQRSITPSNGFRGRNDSNGRQANRERGSSSRR